LLVSFSVIRISLMGAFLDIVGFLIKRFFFSLLYSIMMMGVMVIVIDGA
jgi:hypothetical protein